MRRVLIIGYHGMENFGDDLFLDISTSMLRDTLGVEQLHLSARNVSSTLVNAGVALAPLYPAGRRISRLDWIRQLRAALDSDLVLYAAGSIFAGPQFHEVGRLTRALKFADRLRGRKTPLVGIGISLGPFHHEADRRVTATGLRAFEAVLLRDQVSLDEAVSMGLVNAELSHDLVPMLAEQFLDRRTGWCAASQSGLMRLGLALGPGFHEVPQFELAVLCDGMFKELLPFLAVPTAPQLEFRIFSTCNSATDGDRAVAARLTDRLRGLGFTATQIDYGVSRKDIFIDALLGCDGLVSSRLHPAVVAMGTGIPVMQISATSPKMAGVFERIGLQPIVATRDRYPHQQQWQSFFRAIAGNVDERAGAASISAANVSAFRSAGAACASRVKRLFAGLAGVQG